MTVAELSALVASIDLSTHTPPIRLLVREEGGRVGIQAALDGVAGSADGADGLLVKEPEWFEPGEHGPNWTVVFIWNVVLELVTHELAEHFMVDGKRYMDPHR